MKAHLAEALHPSRDPADPADPPARNRRPRLPASVSRAASALPGVLMLLIVMGLNAHLQPDFFSADSLSSNLQNAAPVILICMAQAVVVLAGELDLSVGAGISLVNCALAGLPVLAGWDTGATCLVALAAALAAGVCNGVLVGYLRQSALIATFATSAIWFGVALLLMPQPGGTVPEVLGDWFAMRVGPVPLAAVPVVAAVALWAVLQRHRFGRRLIATGSSTEAAFKSGIDTRRIKLLAYVLAWLFVFGAALCISAETASGDARLGLPYTLNSVAAVVIGGISLAGGRGSMIGAISGALVLVLIGNVVYFAYVGQAFLGLGTSYVLTSVVVAVIGGVSLAGGRGDYVAVAIAAIFLTVLTSLLTALQIGEAGRQCIFGATLLAFLAINGWSVKGRLSIG